MRDLRRGRRNSPFGFYFVAFCFCVFGKRSSVVYIAIKTLSNYAPEEEINFLNNLDFRSTMSKRMMIDYKLYNIHI